MNTYAAMKSGIKNLDESGCSGAISSQKAQKRLVCDVRFFYFCVSSLIICKLNNSCCYRMHIVMVLRKHIQRIGKTLIWMKVSCTTHRVACHMAAYQLLPVPSRKPTLSLLQRQQI
jgi:hypothetical protein